MIERRIFCVCSLIFQSPFNFNNDMQSISLSNVLWITVCTDFAAKCFVLIAKCFLALIPSAFISVRRKVRHFLKRTFTFSVLHFCYFDDFFVKTLLFQWIEFTSHMYRHWLPVPICWSYLSCAPDAGRVHYVCVNILTVCYVIMKVFFNIFFQRRIFCILFEISSSCHNFVGNFAVGLRRRKFSGIRCRLDVRQRRPI